jgi:hypothetical protein
VGTLFRGEGIEAVWVRKQGEEIDPGWFSQPTTDLLVVMHGQLRVEFEDDAKAPLIMQPGALLVLPPKYALQGLSVAARPRGCHHFPGCLPHVRPGFCPRFLRQMPQRRSTNFGPRW